MGYLKHTIFTVIALAFLSVASNAQNLESVKKAIDVSEEIGFLKKTDKLEKTFYIDKPMWAMMNAETKQNTVKTFARYMGHLRDMDSSTGIYVKDWQSGKTLATYGIWSGVEIK